MPFRSPLINVTPALCIATSVPVPIAIPTCACANAGASLMPSPAIATMRPSACSCFTISAFCSGNTSATTRLIPSLRATTSAVTRLSPVSMTNSNPTACKARTASSVDSLIGSATPIKPAGLPSTATNITVCPSARSASARSSSAVISMPDSTNNF